MFAKMWQSIFNRASHLLTILPSPGSGESSVPQVLDSRFNPLVLPDPPNVRSLLTRSRLPRATATHYESLFNDLIHLLSQDVQIRYEDAVLKMGVGNNSDLSAQTSYLKVLRNGFIASYNLGVEQALRNLVARLTELDSNLPLNIEPSPATSSTFTPASGQNRRGRPFVFSKEQTAVLRALLVHDDQFTSEEKELIAQTLNLTRAQVNRWFCNARARGGRKKPYEKPIPRAQRQDLSNYVLDVCQKQRSTSSSSSSGSSTCSQYPSSDDDVDMWSSNALQQDHDSDDSPYLTTEVDLSENIIPMAQLYSQISSACDDTSPTNPKMEMDTSLPSSNFSFSDSTSSLNEFLLPNDLSSLFTDPDPFNLNTLPDDGFAQSLSYPSSQSEQSWNFS